MPKKSPVYPSTSTSSAWGPLLIPNPTAASCSADLVLAIDITLLDRSSTSSLPIPTSSGNPEA